MLTAESSNHDMVGVNLLVTLLLRYPTIAKVGMTTDKDQLRLSFLIKEGGEQRYKLFEQYLLDILTAYFAIEQSTPEVVTARNERFDELEIIEVTRDLKTLKHGELGLIVEAIATVYADGIICEPIETQWEEEELDMQEEWIGMMLENLRKSGDQHSLLALREGGRVLVYNT